jgi:hypothetical protein
VFGGPCQRGGAKLRPMIAAAVVSCLLGGCAHPSRVTAFVQGVPGGPPIDRIAVAPALGSISASVARVLEREGYTIDDSVATARLLAAHHLDDGSRDKHEALQALASEKVDAVLVIVPDYPGWVLKSSPKYVDVNSYPPEKVAVRLIRTTSGDVVTAFVWENAFCAMRGSPCDNRAKRSAFEAAREVAALVLQSIGPPPGHLIEATPEGGAVVISGVAFRKKGDCPSFTPGQRVRFAVGDRYGACKSAKLVLIRSGEECDVECP